MKFGRNYCMKQKRLWMLNNCVQVHRGDTVTRVTVFVYFIFL